jgi:hypothetical protein
MNYFNFKNKIPINNSDKIIFYNKKYNLADTFGCLTKNGFYKIINVSKNILNRLDNKNFADLGSGDGRIVFWANQFFNNCVGIELSTVRHNEAIQIKNKFYNNKSISLINKDFLDYNYSNFDVIYISSRCFPDSLMEKITNKLDMELKQNTLVFTTSPLKNCDDYEIINVDQTYIHNSNLYLYHY